MRRAPLPIDALLRFRGPFAPAAAGLPWKALLAMLVAAGGVHGALMGCFGLRPLQILYSGVKVPLLLLVSTAVCLPSFFVINTLLGLREDLAAAVRGILAAQAILAVALAALAPFALVLYGSTGAYDLAVLGNGVLFAIATLTGQAALGRHYRRLVAKNRRHRVARASWLVFYVFVAIQAAWVLRPFIGAPGLATRFFREGAWSNAYVVVAETLWNALVGS